jgi:hypothetical protein
MFFHAPCSYGRGYYVRKKRPTTQCSGARQRSSHASAITVPRRLNAALGPIKLASKQIKRGRQRRQLMKAFVSVLLSFAILYQWGRLSKRRALALLYFAIAGILFFLSITRKESHWFGALSFATSTAGAILAFICELSWFGFTQRRFTRLIKRDATKFELWNWIERNHLREDYYNDAPLFIAYLIGLPLSLIILEFYYIPWSPSSQLGELGRPVIYILVALTLSILWFNRSSSWRSRQQKTIRYLLEQSDRLSDKYFAKELAQTEAKRNSEAQREIWLARKRTKEGRQCRSCGSQNLQHLGLYSKKILCLNCRGIGYEHEFPWKPRWPS